MNKDFIFLNTRPQPFNDELTSLLREKLDLSVLQLPTIEIQPIACELSQPADCFIFTSANAVIHSQQILAPYKNKIPVIAIGSRTQKTLANLGWHNVQVPAAANSEAIVELLASHDDYQTIVVITGEDGRGVLKQELSKKQINVIELICYRRVIPTQVDQSIVKKIESENIAIVLITSITCYDNLCLMLGNVMKKLTKSSHWLVFSERIKQHMTSMISHEQIMVCDPNDEAVVVKIAALYKDLDNE